MDLPSAATQDYPTLVRLDGKRIVVFGAGQGIGRESCIALYQAGAELLCVDSDEALAHQVAKDVNGLSCKADVTQRKDIERAIDVARQKFGGTLHGIVDVVGVATIRAIADFDDTAWERQMDIVLRHAFLVLQYGGAMLRSTAGGPITFIGSISGVRSVEGQAIYGAAKAALHHLVRCAAHELGPHGIRVNAIAPGYVRTPRLNARLDESFWRRLEQRIPLQRAGVPVDVAAVVLFLQSAMATYVTGNVIMLDGGASAVAALPTLST